MPEESLFHTYKCFLCAGFGRIAIFFPEDLDKFPESEICPMCNGKGFMKVKKSNLEEGE